MSILFCKAKGLAITSPGRKCWITILTAAPSKRNELTVL